MKEILRRAVTVWILFLAACTSSDKEPASFRVVVLGDASRIASSERLATDGPDGVLFFTPPQPSDVMEVADQARSADFALIVNDSTQGPTPIVREHILLARQLQIPSMGLLLSKTDELLSAQKDAKELLDLEELELRELMNQYQMPGDSAPCYYDSDALAPTSTLQALRSALANGDFPRRNTRNADAITSSVLRSEIYLLTALEVNQVQAIAPGSTVSFLIDGQRAEGVAEASATIQPGDAAPLTIRLPFELTLVPGTRFFLERNGRLIGAGTLVAPD